MRGGALGAAEARLRQVEFKQQQAQNVFHFQIAKSRRHGFFG